MVVTEAEQVVDQARWNAIEQLLEIGQQIDGPDYYKTGCDECGYKLYSFSNKALMAIRKHRRAFFAFQYTH